jgi:Domain of unknown function (DUF6602)
VTGRQSMNLRDVFDSVAKKMLADFAATGAVQHRESKGSVRESGLLKHYLKKYLPRSVTAEHSGEAVSVDGEVSAQCDAMILDPSTPPFWDEEDYRVVPIECVHGVLEVKSFLDSTQLRDAWTKIARIKRMPKKALRSNPGFMRTRTVYGKVWSYVPTCGLVFAYDGADLRTLGTTLVELAEEEGEDHPEFFIDSVWVLNKGALVWLNPDNGRIDPSPEPRPSLGSIDADPGQVLLSLTGHLYEHFGTAWTPEFRIIDYFGHAPLGTFGSKWDFVPPERRASPDSPS